MHDKYHVYFWLTQYSWGRRTEKILSINNMKDFLYTYTIKIHWKMFLCVLVILHFSLKVYNSWIQ